MSAKGESRHRAPRARRALREPGRWWPRLQLPAFLLVVFCVKAVALAQLHDHPLLQPTGELDPAYYVHLARQVAGGDLAGGDRVFFVSPFYIYFLAFGLVLSGGSLLWAQILQIALGTTAVGLVWAAAGEWFDRRAAWVAAALAALTGQFTFNEVLVLQSAVDPFLTALALFLLARAWRRGGAGPCVGAGMAIGVLALNRPNALPFAAIAVPATALVAPRVEREDASWRRPGPLPAAAWVLAGMVAAIAPVAARNYLVSGELTAIASHGGLNFFIGNGPGATGTYRSVEGITPSIAGQDRDARRVAEAAAGRRLSDGEISRYFYALGWQEIRRDPLAAAALFVRKVAYVFNAADVSLNYSYAFYARDEPTILRVLVVGPWLLLPLGLWGLLASRSPSAVVAVGFGAADGVTRAGGRGVQAGAADGVTGARDLGDGARSATESWWRPLLAGGPRAAWWAWVAFVPVYALSVAAFFVSGRYRLPLLVPLCVTAGAGAAATWECVRHRRWPALRWSGALLALLAVATNWPFGLDDGRAAERTERILAFVDSGEEDRAHALLARTEPSHPEPALLLFRVGQAYLERRDAATAVTLFERALAIEPGRIEARLRLGQALAAAGRPGDAVPHLRTVMADGAHHDLAAFELAQAYGALGNRDEALDALRAIGGGERLDAPSQYLVGRLALELGDARLAEWYLARAVARVPRVASVRETLALALSRQGRSTEAIHMLESAVALDPTSASAHLNLAVMLAEAGRYDEARRAAAEALRLRPGYPRARALLEALP